MRYTTALGVLCLALVQSAYGAPREISFRKVVLDKEFRAEGVAVADVNRDGRLDVMAGNLWYEAPTWRAHEIAPVQKYNGAAGYSNCFISFAEDVNHDGWMDQIVIGMPGDKAFWRQNPRNQPGEWTEHLIGPVACNESPVYEAITRGGKRVLVFPDNKAVSWWDHDASGAYTQHAVSKPGQPGGERFSHGLGVGDINGDGRPDILTTDGYYQAPSNPADGPWEFIKCDLGPACAQMVVLDVNGDGLADVISSSAHAKGVWWHERKPGGGDPQFVRHLIDDADSETHAVVMVDLNGDKQPDIVTGKRYWAHGPGGDIDSEAPAVVTWYEFHRKNGEVTWTKHVADTDSGVGTQFTVVDMNGDRKPDIVLANKKGVHILFQVAGGKG